MKNLRFLIFLYILVPYLSLDEVQDIQQCLNTLHNVGKDIFKNDYNNQQIDDLESFIDEVNIKINNVKDFDLLSQYKVQMNQIKHQFNKFHQRHNEKVQQNDYLNEKKEQIKEILNSGMFLEVQKKMDNKTQNNSVVSILNNLIGLIEDIKSGVNLNSTQSQQNFINDKISQIKSQFTNISKNKVNESDYQFKQIMMKQTQPEQEEEDEYKKAKDILKSTQENKVMDFIDGLLSNFSQQTPHYEGVQDALNQINKNISKIENGKDVYINIAKNVFVKRSDILELSQNESDYILSQEQLLKNKTVEQLKQIQNQIMNQSQNFQNQIQNKVGNILSEITQNHENEKYYKPTSQQQQKIEQFDKLIDNTLVKDNQKVKQKILNMYNNLNQKQIQFKKQDYNKFQQKKIAEFQDELSILQLKYNQQFKDLKQDYLQQIKEKIQNQDQFKNIQKFYTQSKIELNKKFEQQNNGQQTELQTLIQNKFRESFIIMKNQIDQKQNIFQTYKNLINQILDQLNLNYSQFTIISNILSNIQNQQSILSIIQTNKMILDKLTQFGIDKNQIQFIESQFEKYQQLSQSQEKSEERVQENTNEKLTQQKLSFDYVNNEIKNMTNSRSSKKIKSVKKMKK